MPQDTDAAMSLHQELIYSLSIDYRLVEDINNQLFSFMMPFYNCGIDNLAHMFVRPKMNLVMHYYS